MFCLIVLEAGVVLQGRETAPVVYDIVTRTIENSGDHLFGVKAVMRRMHGCPLSKQKNSINLFTYNTITLEVGRYYDSRYRTIGN